MSCGPPSCGFVRNLTINTRIKELVYVPDRRTFGKRKNQEQKTENLFSDSEQEQEPHMSQSKDIQK